ncbi:MAG: hypothetical protein HYU84_09425 [Chloroflexi bacterium]|nr:hypothetical protein [Chloroflexota bacterium]
MLKKITSLFQDNRVFAFLVVFRWASLIPALLTIFSNESLFLPSLLVLLVAAFANGVVSMFHQTINGLVEKFPALLFVDLLFSAGILAVSGGSHSPYYLYALSPLLAGAFFFQLRGALVVSAVFTPLYLFACWYASQGFSDVVVLTTQLAGVWLLPFLFAYPSSLLKSVNQAKENLSAAHRQLEIIHDLTVLLQAAPDLISVQERVLGAVTTELGFGGGRPRGPGARRTGRLAGVPFAGKFSTGESASVEI